MEIINKMTISGADRPKLLQCINPYKDEWAVRWAVSATDEGYTWREAWVCPKPSAEWIQEYACGDLKAEEIDVMANGIEWQGYRVCLDAENQHNYFMQSIFILLFGVPVTSAPYYMIKDGGSVAYLFATTDELRDWLKLCFGFVVATKAKYIALRNSINPIDYNV